MNLSKSSIILEPYSDPEFEAYYENLEKGELRLAEIKAKQDGPVNDPTTQRHYFIKIITPLKNVIQKALDYNYAKFQPVSNVALVQNLRTAADDKIHQTTNEKNYKTRKEALLKNDQDSLKAKLRGNISIKLKRIIPAVFGACEGYLVFNMLQSTKLAFIVSFFWGLLTALVTAFGLFLAANFICKAIATLQKKIKMAIVLIAAFLFALSLGIWRANTYSEVSSVNSKIDLNQAAEYSTKFSPWPFIILSFVSFLVALAFEIKFWVTDEERESLRLYEQKSAEVKKAGKERIALEKEIDSIKKNVASDSALSMQKLEYANGNEKRLLSLAYQVVSTYESINVEFRKDKQCPHFFGQKIDFGFAFYFNGIFNTKITNNEKNNGTHSSIHDELMSE